MSLYNLVQGENNLASALLHILGLTREKVPRYRDCFLTEEGRIAIYTRTGGGNRSYYDSYESRRINYSDDPIQGPYNADLRALAGFISDKDDDFDNTYATFLFAVPVTHQPFINACLDGGYARGELPNETWQRILEELNNKVKEK